MTDSNEDSVQHTAQILVDRGREALRANQRRQARRYFTTAVASDPTCVPAWRGLAELTAEPHTALEYLQRAQELTPDDASLRRAIQQLQERIQLSESAPSPVVRPDFTPIHLEPYPSRWRWIVAALILCAILVVIILVGLSLAPGISAQGISPRWLPASAPMPPRDSAPQSWTREEPGSSAASLLKAGQIALDAEMWPRALALLEAAQRATPDDRAVTSARYQAALDWGQWHLVHGHYTTAIHRFDQAQALAPDNLDPARARRQATALRRGQNAVLRGDWDAAIAALAPIHTAGSASPRATAWLYQAYCQRGEGLEKKGQWSAAAASYTRALEVQPEGKEAQQGLARTKNKPRPQPTSTPPAALTGKWIGIDLSNQTLTAYQDSTPVLQAVVSTGTRYHPTPTGRFAIQRKYLATHMSGPGYSLPNVPYTMFFVGGYAIHGTYWHNNFGTPMSHGCVNMRTDQAKWLYEWAPKGTPVVIY